MDDENHILNDDEWSVAAGIVPPPNPKRLFVNYIPENIYERGLENFLSQFGAMSEVSIWRDADTKRSLGKATVEFVDERDALKCLNAATAPVGSQRLVLNGSYLFVDFCRKSNRNRTRKKPFSSYVNPTSSAATSSSTDPEQNLTSNETTTSNNSSIHINDLPYQLLISIFSNLCIRDLCTVEKVCKKWYELGKMTWQDKTKLSFDERSIYENYTRKNRNQYGFDSRPVFNYAAFKQIMRKTQFKNLKSLDLTDLAMSISAHSNDCIELVSYQCPNLVSLVLNGLCVSNKPFGKSIKYLRKLRELDISYCNRLTDIGVARMFQKLPDLVKINLSFCHLINGDCLEATNGRLEDVTLNGCSIHDKFYLFLVKKNPGLKHLSLRGSKFEEAKTILELIDNVPNLETLLLSDSGFERLIGNSEFKFTTLKNLTRLDLDGSRCDVKIVSAILNQCMYLKHLNIGNCTGLDDNMFTLTDINAPLEHLDLSFLKKITDKSLEVLCEHVQTIKTLSLKSCINLTNEGINKMLVRLPNLSNLDIRYITKADNTIIESALDLVNSASQRKMLIKCSDTDVDPTKFVYNHMTTKKEVIDRDLYSYSLDGLTFETFQAKRIKTSGFHGDEDIWDDDVDEMYMGGDSDDSQMGGGFYNPAGNSNDEDQDDFDDFINNDENEMYNELDEY